MAMMARLRGARPQERIALLALAGGLLLAACASPSGAPAAKPASAPTSAAATKPASPASGGAAATAAPAAAPATLEKVRMGTLSPSASDSGWLIAMDRGYFQEQGIELETTPFSAAAEMTPPLGAGQLDAGGGAPSAGLYNAVARGISLRIVADKGGTDRGFGYTGLMVRRDLLDSGEVRSPADLRGRKVALPNLGGISPEAAFDKLMRSHGSGARDTDLTQLGFPDMPAALAGRSVDAAMLIEPFVTLAVEQGSAGILLRQDEWYPEQQVAVILFAEAFAAQRQDAGRRFVTAYLKGVRDYNDAFAKRDPARRAEVIATLTKLTALKDPAIWEKVAVPSLHPDGTVNTAALEEDQEYYIRAGKQQERVDLARMVDMRFLEQARQQLGPYQ
jgi:NitT/TauT family transport system substrate-binding protein